MPSESASFAAFLLGLVGSTHCAGMCGGIAGAITGVRGTDASVRVVRLFIYNLARIVTYAIFGAGLGYLGSQAVEGQGRDMVFAGRWIAGGVTILLGVHLAGWWLALAPAERFGGFLWRLIEPATRKFLPPRRWWHVWVLGALWGFLPCGMVYAALVWATASGSVITGAWLMLCFGLGTLPMMFTAGVLADRLRKAVQKSWVRPAVGVFLIALGVWTIVGPGAHGHDQPGETPGQPLHHH